MALNLVCAVLERGPQDLAEMAVLLAIADSADKDSGEAWPSQVTIARRARQTDRGVRNVLARLRRDGWLTWEERKRANGSRASNVYTVNLVMLGEGREGGPMPNADRNLVPGRARNPVPGGSGTPFRGVPELRSGACPEPRSPLEPSLKIEPSALAREGVEFSAFQRAQLREGKPVIVGSALLRPWSQAFQAAALAARAQDAGEACGACGGGGHV